MTNSDESDMKMEYILSPASPNTSREIQCVFFIGTTLQGYHQTEQ